MDRNKIYFERTKYKDVNNYTRYFYEKYKPNIGRVVDLGCGTGCDTEFFIRHGFYVLSIDSDVRAESFLEKRISNSPELFDYFIFQEQKFETLKLEKNSFDFVIAHNSLSYCEKKDFYNMWNTIKESIVLNGYFVGNFFGIEHDYNSNPNYKKATFLNEKEVLELFLYDFEILEFNNPISKKKKTAFAHTLWNEYLVIAKKISE